MVLRIDNKGVLKELLLYNPSLSAVYTRYRAIPKAFWCGYILLMLGSSLFRTNIGIDNTSDIDLYLQELVYVPPPSMIASKHIEEGTRGIQLL
jgi:hypothetical protein